MIELNSARTEIAGKCHRSSMDRLWILKYALPRGIAKRILDIGCEDGGHPDQVKIGPRNEATLARAGRDNIRSIDAVTALMKPMICRTLATPEEWCR